MPKREQYSPKFKTEIAVEAIRERKTLGEIASDKGIHPSLITRWKTQAVKGLPQVFSGKKEKGQKKDEELISKLYQEIGQLKVELDWLKKKYRVTI